MWDSTFFSVKAGQAQVGAARPPSLSSIKPTPSRVSHGLPSKLWTFPSSFPSKVLGLRPSFNKIQQVFASAFVPRSRPFAAPRVTPHPSGTQINFQGPQRARTTLQWLGSENIVKTQDASATRGRGPEAASPKGQPRGCGPWATPPQGSNGAERKPPASARSPGVAGLQTAVAGRGCRLRRRAPSAAVCQTYRYGEDGNSPLHWTKPPAPRR